MPFLYVDFVVLTALTLGLSYHIARVNWFYMFHIQRIEKIRRMLVEMQTFREHYFGIQRSNDYSLIKLQEELVFKDKLTDPVISAYVDFLVGICPKKNIEKYLSELISVYATLSADLQVEMGLDQITILKVPVTMGFFINTLIGCIMTGLGAIKFIFLTN